MEQGNGEASRGRMLTTVSSTVVAAARGLICPSSSPSLTQQALCPPLPGICQIFLMLLLPAAPLIHCTGVKHLQVRLLTRLQECGQRAPIFIHVTDRAFCLL
jgi:hypothetical protein